MSYPICPACSSSASPKSKLKDKCTFCDGTEAGFPPTEADIVEHNWRQSTDDPCDTMMPGAQTNGHP